MFQNFNIVFDYLLILTIFHVQNVLIIFNWCLCDFLVLKHIDEVYTLHLHLSLTDVDIFLCWKCSRISILFLIIYWYWLFFMCKMFLSFSTDVYVIFLYWNIFMKCTHFIFICHLLMLTFLCCKCSRISILFLIIYWYWLFFMCKMFSSFSTDVYVIFLYWNILMKCTHFIFICHWLMLTFLFVENILEFQYCFWLFTDIDYFSCAKCSYHFQLMFMWFSCTETYWWSVCTSSSFVIYWCWHIFVL